MCVSSNRVLGIRSRRTLGPLHGPASTTGFIVLTRRSRSAVRAFVWLFSFLVKFAQVKNESSPVVLLLDEPGLTLHGKAQADLLRFFKEKLAPHHQVIYSTHSPFMVPADELASVRIVEDQVDMRAQTSTNRDEGKRRCPHP